MAAKEFPIGHVVWAKFSARLYPGVIDPLPDNPDAVGKVCVRWFPDLKNCSYVKPPFVWDYREHRERFCVDKQFKANKDWRKLLITADKHLGIIADIPEPRGSTRTGSSSEIPSETASTGTNEHIGPQQPVAEKNSPERVDSPAMPVVYSHPALAIDAIEMPDEEVASAQPVDQYTFTDEAVAEPPKGGRTSPRRAGSRHAVEKPKSSDKKKPQRSVPAVVNGDAKPEPVEKSKKVVDEQSSVSSEQAEGANRRGRGRPRSQGITVGASPNKRSRVSNGLSSEEKNELKEVKKRGRPPLASPKGLKEKTSNSTSKSRPSLPPLCASSNGNAAFDEAFTSVQRNISSNDLRDMPKILPPVKMYDSKQPVALDASLDSSLRYGFIGLHSLSLVIVRHLRASKVHVSAWDSNSSLVKQAASFGAKPCLSKAQVIDSSDIIFTSLLTEKEAHEAFFTAGEGIVACVDPSKGIVDLGTPNVEYVQQISQMLSNRRVAYLYCATFGTVVDAADCKLSFLVAGSNRLYTDIADLLRSLGGTYETDGHWQDPAKALKAKSISDMLVAAENLAFCEAVGMAQKCGLSTDVMLNVMRHQSKDHFSQCLPAAASSIGSSSELVKPKDATLPLPLCLSATAAMSPDRSHNNVEALRTLTSSVGYSAAFANCFSSLANEHGLNAQSLFVAMHAILSAKSATNASANEDVSVLFQRLASLI